MRKYHKLVRDNIPAIIISRGQKPVYHIAKPGEYYRTLKQKLAEEVAEFIKDDCLEEYIDVLEVMEAVAKHKLFSKAAVNKAKSAKAKKNGKFNKKIILDKIS